MQAGPGQSPALSSWLFDQVCPFWMDVIVDPDGGYFEGLDAAGTVVRDSARKVLTQARLTYVFSHAYCLQPSPQLLRSAEHGFRFLQHASAIAGEDGGWHRSIDTGGSVLDAARDAYDQAFVIFAMAWHYRASANPDTLLLADRAYGFMQAHMADRLHGGFFEEYPLVNGSQKLPRRQNPHMHLLEAVLAMFEATRLPCWLDRGRELVSLFKQHFFEPRSGSLIEYFKADWSPAAGPAGEMREPGHHFEWCWLLHEFARLSDDDQMLDHAQRLFSFASAYGIDTQGPLAGMVFDGVDGEGALVVDSKLLWPQTEYIKANLARAERQGDVLAFDAAHVHIAAMRRFYFKADGASWFNQLTRSGSVLQSATPARVLYHVFLALAEAIRVQPATVRAAQQGKTRTPDGA